MTAVRAYGAYYLVQANWADDVISLVQDVLDLHVPHVCALYLLLLRLLILLFYRFAVGWVLAQLFLGSPDLFGSF